MPTAMLEAKLLSADSQPPNLRRGSQLSNPYTAFQVDPSGAGRMPEPVAGDCVPKPATNHFNLRHTASKAGLFGLWSKGRSQRDARNKTGSAQGGAEVPERPAASQAESWSFQRSQRRPSPDLDRTGPGASPGVRNGSVGASLKRSLRKSPPSRTSVAWSPPPLFQAYPQAIKYGPLFAPTSSAEAVLRTQRDLKAMAAAGIKFHDRPQEENADAGRRYRRQTTMPAVSTDCVSKMYLLTTSGHLLQYSAEGVFDRLPEKVMELTKDSAAFASDALPGKHWVLRISVSCPENSAVVSDRTKFGLSMLGFRSDRRSVSNFLLVMDSADEMDAWLVAVRKEIQALGGQDYRPDVTVDEGKDEPVQHPRHVPSRRSLIFQDQDLPRAGGRSNSKASSSKSNVRERRRRSGSASWGSRTVDGAEAPTQVGSFLVLSEASLQRHRSRKHTHSPSSSPRSESASEIGSSGRSSGRASPDPSTLTPPDSPLSFRHGTSSSLASLEPGDPLSFVELADDVRPGSGDLLPDEISQFAIAVPLSPARPVEIMHSNSSSPLSSPKLELPTRTPLRKSSLQYAYGWLAEEGAETPEDFVQASAISSFPFPPTARAQVNPRMSSLEYASGRLPGSMLHLAPAPHPPPTAALPALPPPGARVSSAPPASVPHGSVPASERSPAILEPVSVPTSNRASPNPDASQTAHPHRRASLQNVEISPMSEVRARPTAASLHPSAPMVPTLTISERRRGRARERASPEDKNDVADDDHDDYDDDKDDKEEGEGEWYNDDDEVKRNSFLERFEKGGMFLELPGITPEVKRCSLLDSIEGIGKD